MWLRANFYCSYGFDHYGGGVFVGDASSLRIKNCWIVDNGIGTGTFAGGVFAGGAGSQPPATAWPSTIDDSGQSWLGLAGGATHVASVHGHADPNGGAHTIRRHAPSGSEVLPIQQTPYIYCLYLPNFGLNRST